MPQRVVLLFLLLLLLLHARKCRVSIRALQKSWKKKSFAATPPSVLLLTFYIGFFINYLAVQLYKCLIAKTVWTTNPFGNPNSLRVLFLIIML
jgi:RsiW-degrading membrane proteinase PrsW (M82 family)